MVSEKKYYLLFLRKETRHKGKLYTWMLSRDSQYNLYNVLQSYTITEVTVKLLLISTIINSSSKLIFNIFKLFRINNSDRKYRYNHYKLLEFEIEVYIDIWPSYYIETWRTTFSEIAKFTVALRWLLSLVSSLCKFVMNTHWYGTNIITNKWQTEQLILIWPVLMK